MNSMATDPKIESRQRIADRYLVEKPISHTGTVGLFRVRDLSTDRHLSLKKLYPRGNREERRQRAVRFEHEFYTLSQCDHPGLVRVYDYGLDDGTPYYTLQLLDQTNLQELAPIAWQKVCLLLYDLASALSLMHVQGFLHCDVSFRSIRCTEAGRLKLFDLGKMTSPGPCRLAFRISPFTAPELYHLQSLDARVDLYALGAIAYNMLTGRNAYPARDYKELHDIWRTQPRPPSAFAPEIPAALDSLVKSLLALDPVVRPSSAQRVAESLIRIADIKLDKTQICKQNYVTSPAFVGREEPLIRVRRQILNAVRSRGGVLIVQGKAGVGRSRFLDVCALEGKIVGAVVARADARDADRGDYGVVRAIALQVLSAVPDLAISTAQPYISVLSQVLPEILRNDRAVSLPAASRHDTLLPMMSTVASGESPRERTLDEGRVRDSQRYSANPSLSPASQADDDAFTHRLRVQSAFLDWFLDITSKTAVVITIDDFHDIDEPSAAVLAVLSTNTNKQKLAMIVTAAIDAQASSPRAVHMIEEASCRIKLRNLGIEDTTKLVASLFGDLAKDALLVERLHKLSRGNAKQCLHFAQRLLDSGEIVWRDRAWSIQKAAVLVDGYPEGVTALLSTLSAEARVLVEIIALNDSGENFLIDYFELAENLAPAKVFAALNQLIAARVIYFDGTRCSLVEKRNQASIADALSEERKQAIYLNLANLLEQRGGDKHSIADYLFRAKQDQRALDVFLKFATDAVGQKSNGCFHVRKVSHRYRWLTKTTKHALTVCEHLGRPRRELYVLQKFALLSAQFDEPSDYTYYATRVLDQLCKSAGMDIWDDLADSSLNAKERMQHAMYTAQQRYHSAPEHDRLMLPVNAVKELTDFLLDAVAHAVTSLNYDLVKLLPSLQPFYPLSAALEAGDQAIQAVMRLVESRYDDCDNIYHHYLKQFDRSDYTEFKQYAKYTRLSLFETRVLFRASIGLPISQYALDELENEPHFQTGYWTTRMLSHLAHGNLTPAEQSRVRAEQIQIQTGQTAPIEVKRLWSELLAYASIDDPVGVNHTIERIGEMAKRFRGWVPIHYFARGEYHRICRDYTAAESHFQKALDLTRPGHHLIWPFTAASYVRTLVDQEHYRAAIGVGAKLLEQAEKANLGLLSHNIRASLAWAEAQHGERYKAIDRCETIIRDYKKREITGIKLGAIYELRARIAVLENDETAFQTYADLCAQQYKIEDNPALSSRYEKLVEEARAVALRFSAFLMSATELSDVGTQTEHLTNINLLSECSGSRERVERTLSLLIAESCAVGGYLYTVQEGGPVCGFEVGEQERPPGLEDVVRLSLALEQDEDDSSDYAPVNSKNPPRYAVDDNVWTTENGDRYFVLLIGHQVREGYAITGVALLRIEGVEPLNIPWEISASLSRTLLDLGDVSMIYAA